MLLVSHTPPDHHNQCLQSLTQLLDGPPPSLYHVSWYCTILSRLVTLSHTSTDALPKQEYLQICVKTEIILSPFFIFNSFLVDSPCSRTRISRFYLSLHPDFSSSSHSAFTRACQSRDLNYPTKHHYFPAIPPTFSPGYTIQLFHVSIISFLAPVPPRHTFNIHGLAPVLSPQPQL